jgi:hypothetical protein
MCPIASNYLKCQKASAIKNLQVNAGFKNLNSRDTGLVG